jgi:hypothetical protein
MAKKIERKSSSWLDVWITIIGIVIVFFGFLYFTQPKELQIQSLAPEATARLPRLVKLGNDWIHNRSDTWLIESELSDQRDLQHEIDLFARFKEQMDFAIDRNRRLPQVEQLGRQYEHKFFITLFSTMGGGTSKFVTKNLNETRLDSLQEVVMFGKFAENHPIIGGQLLFFKAQWNALIMGALQWADSAWFDATFLHELYHAHQFQIQAPTSQAPMLSDLWVTEEIDAHNLEAEVLDLRTGGKLVKKIASKTHSGNDLMSFMDSLQAKDIQEVDTLFSSAGVPESGTRLTEYELMFATEWLKQHGFSGDQLKTRQIQAYRELFGTVVP